MRHKIKFITICLAALLCGIGLHAQTSILTFDGVDDCVAIGDMGAEITTQYTAEAWIKPASLGSLTTQYGRTIFASSTANSKPLWLTHLGSELRVYTFVGPSNSPYHDTSGAGLTVGHWHHVAVSSVKSGTTVVYVDGVPLLSVPSGTEDEWNTIFTIGDLRPGRGLAFHGEIADVRVWNTIRTETEIQENMYGEIPAESGGLVGYWKLDGDTLDSSDEPVYDGAVQNGMNPQPSPDWNGLELWIEEEETYVGYEEEFTLYVKIRNVPWNNPMRGFEVTVNYDPAYLESISFAEESFLSDYAGSASGTQFYTRGEEGAYIISNAILSVPPGTWDHPFGASGDGTIFSMTLKSLTKPSCYTGIPITLPDVILRNEINQPITPGSITGAEVYIHPTLVIPLRNGWNMISSWVIPPDMTIESVFAHLREDGYLIKVQDELGRAYLQDTESNWINNIGNYEMNEGYYVKVNENCELVIEGECVILPMTVELREGWNIIPYPYHDPQPALQVIQPLIDSGVLIKVQNELGQSIVQGTSGEWEDFIETFGEGKGYYVKVNTDTSITFYPPGQDRNDKSIDKNNDDSFLKHVDQIDYYKM